MATKNGGTIRFGIQFDVNKSSLNQITKQLQAIQTAATTNKDSGLAKQFDQAASAARKLEQIINSSWNHKLDQLNLNKFNQSVKTSFGSVQNLKNQLIASGASGQTAFASLASSILNTNIQLRESNKLLDSMAVSMKNTIKWGITSSIFNKITGSIQQAYYYAKDLNTSLTDIRMVTGASADEMQRFAKTANDVSKSLGRSTLDYTKGAVEYYRQGLTDEQVAKRTEVTLKAQNITGAGKQMVDYLTAVWNGFKINTENAEKAVDSLAKVADSSASNMAQLATAMSKVAATANVVGVDFDQLNAMIATVVATTRLAPESVGTAFKTVFARINDIKTGAEDAEISLGNYSGRMQSLGISVLDTAGRLRDTGDVITEVGQKWGTLTKQQQTYLAATMGGQRQITQVMALFDNWNQYVNLLNTSLQANGTLNEKNNIYLESTAAHLQQLSTQAQRTYDILIDTDAINGLVDALNGVLGVFNDFIEGLGGGANAFAYFGSMVAGVFSKQISQAILNAKQNFDNFKNAKNIESLKQEFSNQILENRTANKTYETTDHQAMVKAAQAQAEIYQKTLVVKKGLTQQSYNQLMALQQQIGKNTAKIALINSYKDRVVQVLGYEERSTENMQEAADAHAKEAAIYEQNISALNRLLQSTQKNKLSWQEVQEILRNNNQLLQTSDQEVSNFIEKWASGKPSQAEIVQLLQNQINKLQTQKGYEQEIIELIKLKEAYQRNDAEAIEKQNQILKRQAQQRQNIGKISIDTQKMVKGVFAVGQAFTALTGAAETFGRDGATAAQKANAAFSGITGTISAALNMIPGIGPAIGMAFQGVAGLIKGFLGESFEQLFMSVEEKIAKIQQKIQKANQVVQTKQQNISSLIAIQQEYNKLSDLAGEYGQNLNKMSDEQISRYHELTNEFTKYNDSVIVGYDAQGQAIIRNKQALQETIDKLKEQQEAQAQAFLSDPNNSIKSYNSSLVSAKSRQTNEDIKLKTQAGTAQDSLDLLLQQFAAVDEFGQSIGWGKNILSSLQLIKFNESGITKRGDSPILDAYNDLQSYVSGSIDLTIDEIKAALSIIQTAYNGIEEENKELADFLSQTSNYVDEIQNLQQEIDYNDANLPQEMQFDTSFISTLIKWGKGYNREYKKLAEVNFLNKDIDVDSLIYDFISGFTYKQGLKEIDIKNKQASSYDQVIDAARNYAENLLTTITASEKIIYDTLEQAKVQGKTSDTSPIIDRLTNSQAIIQNILSQLKLEDFKDEGQLQGLADYLAQILGLDTLILKIGQNGIEIDTIDIVPDQILTDAKTAIEEKIFSSGYNRKTIKIGENRQTGEDVFKNVEIIKDIFSPQGIQNIFSAQQLDNFETVLNSIWGGVENALKEIVEPTVEDYNRIVSEQLQIFRKNKEELDNLTNIDFDTAFTNFEKLVGNLKDKKALSDEEKEYLQLLEQQDLYLKNLAETEGRGSQEYINYLKKRKSLGQQIYLQEQQTIIDANRSLLESETNEEERLRLENEISEALYNQARAAQAVKIQEQAIAKARSEAIKSSAQQKMETIPTAKSTLEKLQAGQNISESDATNLVYLQQYNQNLATIAQEQGIYSKAYQDELRKTIALHSNLVELGKEQLLIELEKEKIQANNALTEANNKLESAKKSLEDFIAYGGHDSGQVYQGLVDGVTDAKIELESAVTAVQTIDGQILLLNTDVRDTVELFEKVSNKLDKGLVIDPSSLYTTLENTENLSDAQTEYLNRLEEEDTKLKQLAITQGRSSREYIEYLKTRRGLAEEIYKQDLQAQKLEIQGNLASARTRLQYDSSLTTEERKSLLAQIDQYLQDILNIDYEINSIEQALNKTYQDRLVLFNELTNRKDLNENQQAQLSQLLNELVQLYPELSTAATILNDTWLVGTQAYNQALKQVEDTLEQLNYQQLQDKLNELSIHIDLENLEDCMDEIEEFLDVERQILIEVHTDAENEFDRLQAEMDRIYDASSKIGQNFIVAADDIRELNNVFPGILSNMQDLHDGTVRLNQDAVQQAIAGASQVVAADAQSVNQQLQSQANLLHAKAVMYQNAGDIANQLAQGEIQYANLSASEQATLMAAAGSARVDAASQAAQGQEQNFSNVATESGNAAASMAQNFSGGANAMASAIAQMTQHAINNLASIASASSQVMSGSRSVSAGVDWGGVSAGYGGGVNRVNAGNVTTKNITSSYTGSSGGAIQNTTNFLGTSLADRISQKLGLTNNTQNDWAKLRDQFYDLAAIAEQGATDIQGMMAQNMLDLNSLANELGNAASGRPKSGSGGGGGGGGGKQPDVMQPSEQIIDRYHDIDMQLKMIAVDLEKLQEEQERAFGKDLVKNLNKQLDALEHQNAAYQTRLEITQKEAAEMRALLAMQGTTFDEDGLISNFANVMSSKLAGVNATIDYYNSLSAQEQEAYKETVEAAKEDYEHFKEQIEHYDELISETIPEFEKNIRDNLNKRIEIQVSKFKMSVEIELDLAKAEKDWNKFRKKVINQIRQDDILGNTKALFEDLATYYSDGGLNVIGALTNQLNGTLDQLHQIDTFGTSSVYGDNKSKAVEDLKTFLDELISNLEDVEDLIDEIENSIFDAIDKAQDAFDDQVDTFEHISDVLDHNVKLVKMLYGEQAYDALGKYYQLQEANNNQQLDFLRQQKQLWYDRMMLEYQRMNELEPDSDERKKVEKRFKQYKQHWMKSTKELNSLLESSVQNIIDKYANAINNIFNNLNKRLTGGRGLEYISEEWQLINKEADMYLDRVNSMYEIEKLQNAFRDAINDNEGNIKAQQSLNDLMQEELKYLRDKDKLTQYDVDRANALLQIEIKRLALQNAQQNKTKLRLRRDSQGNYSYQYTSDQGAIAKSQDQLAQAQNNLYNLTKNAYKSNLQSFYDIYEEWVNKVKEVQNRNDLDSEQKAARRAELTEHYGNIINGILSQNEQLRQFLTQDTFNELLRMYLNDIENFKFKSEEEKAIFQRLVGSIKNDSSIMSSALVTDMGNATTAMATNMNNATIAMALSSLEMRDKVKEYLDSLTEYQKNTVMSNMVLYWNSGIQDMMDTIIGEGGFSIVVKSCFTELERAALQFEKSLRDLAAKAGVSLGDIDSLLKTDVGETKALIKENETLIKKYGDEISTIGDLIEKVKGLTEKYGDAKQAAIDAATEAKKYWEAEQKAAQNAAEQVRKATQAKSKYNESGYNGTVGATVQAPSSSPSNGGGGGSASSGGGSAAVAGAYSLGYTYNVYAVNKTGRVYSYNNLSKAQTDALSTKGWNVGAGGIYVRRSDGSSRNFSPGQVYGFKTGGYTGDWSGTDGKLAMLHQRELVLNAEDTQNILKAVDVTRMIDDMLSSIGTNVNMANILNNTNTSDGGLLDQNVHITATFPNVTNHAQVEQALETLVNRASQYAFRNR